MKKEFRVKPPSFMPHPTTGNGKVSSGRGKTYKFNIGYDSYQGILKRVSDMELHGSLDSEEPGTESEKSECSSDRNRRSRGLYWDANSLENNSGNGSLYEEESSGSSFGGSDHCPPYEEIRTDVGNGCRYPGHPYREEKYMNLNSAAPYLSDKPRFRRRSSGGEDAGEGGPGGSEYKNSDIILEREHRDGRDETVETRVYSNCDKDRLVKDSERGSEDAPENNQGDNITDAEKHQIETFFRGLRTDLYVSSSLANLYVGWKDAEGKWSFKHTGVPLILLDRGETKSRNKKKIQIMLAERGTCFPLWKDTIDNLSSYRKAGEGFHTMYLSSDHRQLIGLSFDSAEESDLFYGYMSELTSDPENINISVPGTKKNKKCYNKKTGALPHKDEISNPCLFEHVTSVVAKDKSMYMSLQTLLHKEYMNEREKGFSSESKGLTDWRR